MELFDLKVAMTKNNKIPQGKNLKDMMGAEFDKYYGGWKMNTETKEEELFFYAIPKNLIDLLPTRLTNIGIKYETRAHKKFNK